ncbi:MAG: translation elongation factor Ts [Candidatus Eisenbacteria bacterium]|uniref:Elongation factor Ts n=1 Tax=Eiseniibacteriota bacterium TaxID=2212470 RepID=A0A7Y2EAV7_UNCEI|nr:translation elongation factor Ts [Candidatus Eisenbacteria bacterium]
MTAISASMVSDLRARTGAGIMDCKKALAENDGDIEKAVDHLRKAGVAKAAKKAGRTTAEGLVHSYIHTGGKIGVLLELNCETDFVARNEKFSALAHDLAMHIAASSPVAVEREDVAPEIINKEREFVSAQARESGKPDEVVEKMVEGRIGKFYGEIVLMEQPFVKDPDKKVSELITDAISTIGENIKIKRFTRFELGAED